MSVFHTRRCDPSQPPPASPPENSSGPVSGGNRPGNEIEGAPHDGETVTDLLERQTAALADRYAVERELWLSDQSTRYVRIRHLGE
jgi:hypothetical protein